MKKSTEGQTKSHEPETPVWNEDWLQTERELTEISEADEAKAVVWRNTALRRGRDVQRVTVRPERR